jgi:thioredoxin 1
MKLIPKNLIMISLLTFVFACSGQDTDTIKVEVNQKLNKDKRDTLKPMITFVELGSVKCIPCRKMQPVMKAIEEKYGDQIEVIFYDVWKSDQRKYAEEYDIRLIPTQVFLDKDGKELFRHEGFFPEESIDKFLKEQGLSPKEKS